MIYEDTEPSPNSPPDENPEKFQPSSSSNEESEPPSQSFLPVYRVKMKYHSLPLLIAIIISGVISWYIHDIIAFETVIPENTPTQGLINGLIYTVFAVISSIIIYFLVKKKGQNILKIIMTVAFIFLTFTLVLFFGILIIPNLESSALFYYLYMVFCAVLALSLTYLYFSGKLSKISKNIYVLAIGTLIGAFMGIALPTWTSLVLLIGVSVWDFISVKRGPIKGIMEIMGHVDYDAVKNLTNDEFYQAEIQIGIGDVAFYSMLTSGCFILCRELHVSIINSLIVTMMAAGGIILGAFITIRALRKNALLPGLPLSIFFGIVFAFLTWLVQLYIEIFKYAC